MRSSFFHIQNYSNSEVYASFAKGHFEHFSEKIFSIFYKQTEQIFTASMFSSSILAILRSFNYIWGFWSHHEKVDVMIASFDAPSIEMRAHDASL